MRNKELAMLGSFKEFGKGIGRELSRAWENLAEGWRELLTRSGNALTHFVRKEEKEEEGEAGSALARLPSWGLLAGEVMETDKSVVVRIELPGMQRDEWDITVEGNTLILRGEKRMNREYISASYHLMERAYGSFQRVIPLPRYVDPEGADASYESGVLTVTLPKLESAAPRRLTVR
jgi:HSP20 family protein